MSRLLRLVGLRGSDVTPPPPLYTAFISENWSSYGSLAAATAVHTNVTRTDLMSLDSINTYNGIQTLRYSFPAGTEVALFKTFNAASAVDITNDWINITAHGFVTGRKVRYRMGNSATVIGGLTDDTIYYAIAETADRLRLALSPSDAASNIYINLTSTGSGTSQGIHATIAADGLGTGHPLMERNFGSNKGNIWAKFLMRWEPGFATNTSMGQVLGDYYATSASAYKHWGFGMVYANGRALQAVTNSTQYQTEIVCSSYTADANGSTSSIPPGDPTDGLSTAPTSITTEWSDGAWYEYIGHYWVETSTRSHFRAWSGPVGGPYTQRDYSQFNANGATSPPQFAPSMNRFMLAQNFNKYRDPGNAVYLNWGPYELVDGSIYADPYGLGAG